MQTNKSCAPKCKTKYFPGGFHRYTVYRVLFDAIFYYTSYHAMQVRENYYNLHHVPYNEAMSLDKKK